MLGIHGVCIGHYQLVMAGFALAGDVAALGTYDVAGVVNGGSSWARILLALYDDVAG